MLCSAMKYHLRQASIMSVVNILEGKKTGYGFQVRYTFPQVLVWSGDDFGYLEELRTIDIMTGINEKEALQKIQSTLETIFTWEQRKAFDGITPVIPQDG